MPTPDFRTAVISELRFQLSRGHFDLGLASVRLGVERGAVLDALTALMDLGLAAWLPDAGWVLSPVAEEVA